MSQVMSPLGALLVNTTAANPGSSPTGNSSSPTGSNGGNCGGIIRNDDHQVLKLMSVSLLNESSRALNFHHSLALTLATGNCRPPPQPPKMTFRPQHQHHVRPDSTRRSPTIEEFTSSNSPSHSPSHNNGTTISSSDTLPLSQNMNDEDADEVLSIGRDDDQILLDCDSSLMSEDETTIKKSAHSDRRSNGEDNDNDNSGSDDLFMSNSPSPSRERENNFPNSHNSRSRNYSSEDCSSIKSFPPFSPFSTLSEAIMKQQQQQQQHQASLIFSIANILRPDFGVGTGNKLPNINSKPNRKHHHHLNNNYSTNNSHAPSSGLKRPANPSTKSHHPSPNKVQRRHEPIIPIDLSRPGHGNANGSPLPIPLPQLPASAPSRTHKSTSHRNKSGQNGTEKPAAKTAVSIPTSPTTSTTGNGDVWPAWVYCTRYSDRPSSGPRSRRGRKKEKEIDEKRPRTAFTSEQLSRLKKEFEENRYLTEKRRQDLARDLRLHENQIKIWFQNKRAKLKKSTGQRGGLALQLMAQGLYNHSTIQSKGCGQDEDEDSD